jgi:transcriptional regulator with XRE-family HTH domain
MKDKPAWCRLLAEARESVNLSQERLALISGVSLGSVKAYEQGRRHPSRTQLVAMLDAMRVSRIARNGLLVAAGFAAESVPEPTEGRHRGVTREEAIREIGAYRWPAFLCNESAEILGANTAGRKLWQIEPFGSLCRLGDPVLCVATHPEVCRRLVNWDEAVAQQIAGWKSHYQGAETLDEPSAYFESILARLNRGDPQAVKRFLQLWDVTPPAYQALQRWPYRIVWDEPGYGVMRFQCFAWSINREDGLDIDDWIPADAETWVTLDRFLGEARD